MDHILVSLIKKVKEKSTKCISPKSGKLMNFNLSDMVEGLDYVLMVALIRIVKH